MYILYMHVYTSIPIHIRDYKLHEMRLLGLKLGNGNLYKRLNCWLTENFMNVSSVEYKRGV